MSLFLVPPSEPDAVQRQPENIRRAMALRVSLGDLPRKKSAGLAEALDVLETLTLAVEVGDRDALEDATADAVVLLKREGLR